MELIVKENILQSNLVSSLIDLSGFDQNININVETLKNNTSLKSSSESIFLMGKQKNKKLKVKTLFGDFVLLKEGIKTILEAKKYICSDINIKPNEIMMISDGKELNDSDFCQSLSTPKIFVVVRSSVKSCLKVSIQIFGETKSISTEFPAGTKIFHIKRELYNRKIVSFRPEAQRLIIGGKLLMDENSILGDYVIGGSRTCSRRNDRSNIHLNDNFIIYVSKTVNATHEINLHVEVNETITLKFPFAIGQAVNNIHQVLYRQYNFPKHFQVNFSLKKQPPQVQQQQNQEYKNSPCILLNSSDNWMSLTGTMSLLDYNITESDHQATVKIDRGYDHIRIHHQTLLELMNNNSDSLSSSSSNEPKPVATKKRTIPQQREQEQETLFRGMKKGFLSTNKNNQNSKKKSSDEKNKKSKQDPPKDT